MDVTTSEGAKKVVRRDGAFVAELEIAKGGKYALMLDVGQKMARRYYVEIDGKSVVDFANFWLPPTTSWFSDLSPGRHTIRVLGEKDDKPVLFHRPSEDRTVLRSPVAEAVDYVVFAGPTADEVIASYRQLTGIWAHGTRNAFPSKETGTHEICTSRERRKTNFM